MGYASALGHAAALALALAQDSDLPRGPITFFRDINGAVYSLDPTRMTFRDDRTDKSVTVWVYVDHTADRTTKARTVKELVVVYCGSQTYAVRSYNEYGVDGSAMRSWDSPYASPGNIVPDTFPDGLAQTVCPIGK